MSVLDSVRIIDLTQVWAGPLCTRILADFGAEVIKLESTRFPDRMRYLHQPVKGESEKTYNRGGYFHQFNRNKYGITLDLSKPKGRDLFKKLVAKADVVVENYSMRVQENLGITYPELCKIKPDVIMLSMHGYGSTGPYRNGPAFGSTIEAMAGMKNLLGYGDGIPIYAGACIGDPVSGIYGAIAVLAAIHNRRKTGKGRFIDLSMHECVASVEGDAIIEYTLGKRDPQQMGARHATLSPYGSYPCKGEDSWVAICVNNDNQWEGLCKVIGNPELQKDMYADPLERHRNQDSLDRIIETWTRQQEASDVMSLLQQEGVPAGSFFNGMEVLNNDHLRERQYFWEVDCPDTGRYPQVGPLVRLSETPAQLRMPPPALGEHNKHVLGDILKISDKEISLLEKEGVIGDRPAY